MRENRQIIVGTITLAAAALFLAFATTTGGFAERQSGYTLIAEYRQVDGLRPGAPVHMAGVQIGEVSALRLDAATLRAIAEMTVRDEVRVPNDSAALIVSDGLLGEKYVKIEPGAEDDYLSDGDRFLFVQNAIIVEEILARIVQDAERRQAGDRADTPPGGGQDDGR